MRPRPRRCVRSHMRLVLVLALAACQSHAPTPPPPAVVTEVPAEHGGDLERWTCEHTSWDTSPERQREARTEEEREDRAFVEHRANARHPGTITTPLTIHLTDGYAWLPHHRDGQLVAESCTGVAPHHVEVLVDGVSRGAIDIPCMEGMQAPPRSWTLPAFDVPPGIHRIRVREGAHAITDTRDLVFPESDGDEVLANLEVWCSETRFSISDLEGIVMRL